jgi:hypothetical protein
MHTTNHPILMNDSNTKLPVVGRRTPPAGFAVCGWSGREKCTRPAVWECLLYEGEQDETWTPFCGHHYGMAKFHGWKVRGLSGASIACGSREGKTSAARPPVDL